MYFHFYVNPFADKKILFIVFFVLKKYGLYKTLIQFIK